MTNTTFRILIAVLLCFLLSILWIVIANASESEACADKYQGLCFEL